MHSRNPRDIAELRESFQALRLAVELVNSDAEDTGQTLEMLDMIIRTADRSSQAVERIFGGVQ